MMIVVQHTPKCAGRSLRRTLEDAFGETEVIRDYGDRIIEPDSISAIDPARYWADATNLTPRGSVIIGHFPIRKYAHLTNATRVALIRHPVERAISHYRYWMHHAFPNHAIWTYVAANKLDLIEFARLPVICHFYRQFFFAEADASQYDLIIFRERFDHGVERLSQMIDRPLQFVSASEGKSEREIETAATMQVLYRILADEIAFYEKVQSWPCAVWFDWP